MSVTRAGVYQISKHAGNVDFTPQRNGHPYWLTRANWYLRAVWKRHRIRSGTLINIDQLKADPCNASTRRAAIGQIVNVMLKRCMAREKKRFRQFQKWH